MKKQHILFIGLFVIVSCSTKTEKKSIEDGQQELSTIDTILYKNEVIHSFSSLEEKDSFQLYLTGRSIINGHIIFKIKTKDGNELLAESFPSSYFLDYGIDHNASDAEKEEYIKRRASEFFLEEHFHQPAIRDDTGFDEDYTEKEVWDDIKSDTTAVGFIYLLGGEDNRSIAYSKKLKRVVLYFNCC